MIEIKSIPVRVKAVAIESTILENLKDPKVALAYVRDMASDTGPHRSQLILQALMDVAHALIFRR